MATPKNSSVIKALEILELCSESSEGYTITEIAEYNGLAVATAHRFIQTLTGKGALTRTAAGRLEIGPLIVRLASRVDHQESLVSKIQPFMKQLTDQIQETCHLAILAGDNVQYIAKQECTRSLKINTYIGKQLPAYCTALGRVLLSELSSNDLERYFSRTDLVPFTPNTVTEKTELLYILKKVSTNGYAMDDEEIEEGLRCIAAPVRNADGVMVGAISISAPKSRITGKRLKKARASLMRCAQMASEAI